MPDLEEVNELYLADPSLKTIERLMPLSAEVVKVAQERMIAEGQDAAWVNSHTGTLVGTRVSELIFSAAVKSGVTLREEMLADVDTDTVLRGIGDNFVSGSADAHIVGTASWAAKLQVASEVEDKGNRLLSTSVEDLGYRAGAISLGFLRELGVEIDSEVIITTLNDGDETSLSNVSDVYSL